MISFEASAYGPVLGPLLQTDRRRALDEGTPDSRALAALRGLSVEAAFAHAAAKSGRAPLADVDMATCCIAGVWLLHDYLDESHTVSQGIDTTSGSFWHAIMHRRERDFSNAKYWFRHVGHHPVFDLICQRAAKLAAARGHEQIVRRFVSVGTWDPFAFVDICQAAVCGLSDAGELCLDIQQAECELLFDHCYRMALGA
ncbi:MAG TPA: hypothetical protein VHE81_23140 [Lacipirellulaceae bacterium]|nr:hypothetical protein [Lacipirellulaceae bacterium]